MTNSPQTLVVATGNPGKVKELARRLAGLPWQLIAKPDELDIEETGTTFGENAFLKASQIAQATGQWAIADDSGLAVDALDGAPGLYSARYGSTDPERIAKLLAALEGVADRRARFVCAIAVANPRGEQVILTEGICEGEISIAPRGDRGFGYDPIFFVPDLGKTFAEMDPDTKDRISHRGRALAQLLPQLAQLHP